MWVYFISSQALATEGGHAMACPFMRLLFT